MRVLGIDPGTNICGWGLVSDTRPKATHLGNGAIRMVGELSVRLCELFSELEAVIQEHSPDIVAVEGVFHHKNARSALILGHARGVALLCAARSGLPVSEYSPATVKKSVVGNGRAQKEQVQKMVGSLLGIKTHLVADAADALAVALCHIQHAALAARLSSIRPYKSRSF